MNTLSSGPRQWRSHLSITVLAWLASWLLRGLFLTLRPIFVQRDFERQLLDTGRPVLLAIWHGRLLYFIHLYRNQTSTTLVSQSKDGELISKVLERFGLHATRGSSSRGGGKGLRQLIQRIRQGDHGAFTPDGPRGPRYHVKVGLLSAAQKTGAPILPAVYNAKWKRVLRSWDRFIVPFPFSRIVVVYGKPIYVPATGPRSAFEEKRQEVETTLRQITDVADNFFRS